MLSKSKKEDLRVRRTRELLVRAFNDLIAEKDFAAMTVSDIAELAMINRATFYAHFTDKYDLFAYVVRRSFKETVCDTMPCNAEFNRSNLSLLLQAVFAFMESFDSGCQQPPRVNYWSTIVSQIQQQLCEVLLDLLTVRSQVKLTATAETTAVFMSWSIFGMALQWNESHVKQPLDELTEQLLNLLEGGVYQLQNGG